MSGTKTIKNLKNRSVEKSLNIYQKIINYVFSPMHLGRLTISLPNGEYLTYGNGSGEVEADIKVVNNDFFKKCVLYGDVGFGESYVDGDWQTEDITKVIEWMILNVENHPTLMSDKTKQAPVNFLKIINNMITPFRNNTIRGSQKNIHKHYDLGNDFYKLFLDPSMTYSAAYFKNASDTLERAQYQKYEQLCQKVFLCESDHLLEIGSGWGGFAVYAAKNFGCRVTTVTVSQEQYKYAKNKIKEEELEDKITIELKDYRKLTGKFDKIVSIEMLEAVGHEHYKSYFQQCHYLLKKEGLLAIQVILSPDHRYDSFRKNIDWIQKHIFPGSLLPSVSVIQENIKKTGDLCLFNFEDMTLHYAKTLKLWYENFNLKTDDIKLLGLDDSFIRKWNYYWCYCTAAFKTRNISVAQLIFTRPNNMKLNGKFLI